MKTKIAVIGTRGLPACYSGVEKSLEEIVRRMPQDEYEFIIYGHSQKSPPSPSVTQRYPNAKLVNIPTLRNKYLATMISSFLATLRVLSSDVNIVHYHSLGPALFCLLPRLLGKKVIVTIHGLDWKRKKWPFFAQLFLWVCQFPALYFPHKTIVVSQTLKSRFGKKVAYIPQGVGCVNATSGRMIEYLGIEKEGYLLYAGRISEEKGIQYLIEAFNQLSSSLKLVIAGQATYAKAHLRRLKASAGPNVIFAGFVSEDDLAILYRNAYITVCPSEIEGLSLTLLEALAYGSCVVASDIPEFREILGQEGIYFRKKNSKELCDKLQWLIAQPNVAAWQRQHARAVAERYSWDTSVSALADIYQQVARDRRKRY